MVNERLRQSSGPQIELLKGLGWLVARSNPYNFGMVCIGPIQKKKGLCLNHEIGLLGWLNTIYLKIKNHIFFKIKNIKKL